jgi:septum formation topological specificity factor MinE
MSADDQQPSAAQQMQVEILSILNRYRQESDITVCEILGVLKLVEIAIVVAHTRD